MKNLIIIAAIGKKRELGVNNDLIWRIEEDLRFFRNTTMGHYIFMGRKTYESMPKNLPGRKYLVLSRELSVPGLKTFQDVDTFLEFARKTDETIFVIGGGQIYSMLLPCVDKMILTEIDEDHSSADVFFPAFNKDDWTIEKGERQMDGETSYRRNIYTRAQVEKQVTVAKQKALA